MRLWPFDGPLATLLGQPGIVVAETYPGEIYGHLGLGISAARHSKRRQADRRSEAPILVGAADRLGIDLADAFTAMIAKGFGDDSCGEDRFDAAVGLFGTVNVLRGSRAPGDPTDSERRTIEGWILGQVDL